MIMLKYTNQWLYFCFTDFSRPLKLRKNKFIAAMEILLKWEIIVNSHAITYGPLKRMCKVLYTIPLVGTYIYMPQKKNYVILQGYVWLVLVESFLFVYVVELNTQEQKRNQKIVNSYSSTHLGHIFKFIGMVKSYHIRIFRVCLSFVLNF